MINGKCEHFNEEKRELQLYPNQDVETYLSNSNRPNRDQNAFWNFHNTPIRVSWKLLKIFLPRSGYVSLSGYCTPIETIPILSVLVDFSRLLFLVYLVVIVSK